jgi:hypothetical protein
MAPQRRLLSQMLISRLTRGRDRVGNLLANCVAKGHMLDTPPYAGAFA